jgi:hypothetical protein
MEREKFEDKFRKAFDHAEVNPSENVWTNLELELAKAEGVQMKRRLVFFKMLAAASVIFALGAGAMSLYLITDRNQLTSSPNGQAGLIRPSAEKQSPDQDAQVTNEVNDQSDQAKQETDAELTDKAVGNNPGPSIAVNDAEQVRISHSSEHASDPSSLRVAGTEGNESYTLRQSPNFVFFSEQKNVITLSDGSLEALRLNRDITLPLPSSEKNVDPVAAMLARLAQREAELANSKSKKSSDKVKEEKLWTSLGFAAGSFNTISSGSSVGSSQPTLASNTSIADQEAKASGFAYTMGVNMGTRVSDRWIVQGGVNYLMQTSDYTAQAAIGSSDFTSFRPASINELEKLNHADAQATSRVVTTAPYNVNNNVRYLSLPIQAGYLVVDKKVGVQLNAGISTDLFLHNNKTAESDNIDQISQGLTDDSPYRSMNFSGLVGTELSYRFSSRYRIALNPGLRYPLSSVYKSNLGIQSTPLTFDIGLRFRYIFH